MDLDFRRADGERAVHEIADWISAGEWPYHGTPRPTREQVLGWNDGRHFTGEDNRAFWIVDPGSGDRVGLVVLHELTDPTPIFDLRIRAEDRRRGIGRAALAWLAEHVFREAGKRRVEGHTRADNQAMRGVFRSAGWVMEAYHRQAWPDPAGAHHDAVTYALLESDWRLGTRTPVVWDD